MSQPGIKKLQSKKIALLGLGLENAAFLTWLAQKNISTEITICDQRSKKELSKNISETLRNSRLKIFWRSGENYNQSLNNYDLLLRSPGWPLNDIGLKAAKRSKKEISSPLQLFLDLCPTKKIIGVTGTKGKGTTATLIYKIIQDTGKTVWLGGNIGIAPFSFLSKIKSSDYLVLELSSFQLENLNSSPRIAVITNFYAEHLAPADPNNPNFHSSLSTYWRAKMKIAQQPGNKKLIVNYVLKNKLTHSDFKGPIKYFHPSNLPSKLVGQYNRENIGAAVAVAKLLKIPAHSYQKTVAAFKNMEHRLEFVAEKMGVKYFNNSFATTPESTIQDLKSFNEAIVLIAGGADKGANFQPLAQAIKKTVKFLILLPGPGTNRIKLALKTSKFDQKKIKLAATMAMAVQQASRLAVTGDLVLLSTACASFGLFKNYKERGEMFKKNVLSIK